MKYKNKLTRALSKKGYSLTSLAEMNGINPMRFRNLSLKLVYPNKKELNLFKIVLREDFDISLFKSGEDGRRKRSA